MRTLPSLLSSLGVVALVGACEQPAFVQEERALRVRLLEPADSAPLPLSSATQVRVEAAADDATIEAIELALEAEGCVEDRVCPRLDLSRSGQAVRGGQALFCLTTQLAPAEVCPGEAARLDVTGLVQGQGLRLSASASARARQSHRGQSAPITLALADDRAPVVTLESALPAEDNRYGPGDRIAIALRVTDEQSGVGQVVVRTRGLGGRADLEQSWSLPEGASSVRGLAIVPVPGSFLCPGTFTLETEVADLADPPNHAVVSLGAGCVGACSDHTPASFANVVLDVPAAGRVPPFATAGDQLTLSFDTDDDVFLDGDPVVELVHDPPGLHPGDDKSSVIATLTNFVASGQGDAVPGASYVYRYTVRGDEPPGRYLVRVTVVDPHCNAAVVQRDLLIDFTPEPTSLRVDPGQRGATFLRLDWDLPPGPPPPLHLSWQSHDGVPLPGAYVEIVPAPLLSPYLHQGLTPASRYAYRLVAESAVTPGLFTAATTLDQVCTLPASPLLSLVRSTQVSLVVAAEVGDNPAGTPLDLYRCSGVCSAGSCSADLNTCALVESDVLGERTLAELQPSTCYALRLVARGCDLDVAAATLCARTQDAIAPPNWIQVAARTEGSVTFEWQRVVGTAQDAVTAYEVADAADAVLATVPQVDEGQVPRHTVAGLQPGQPTAVKVRVLRESGGAGLFSPPSTGHALAATPGGVSGVAEALGAITLTLDTSLNAGQCATQYRVTDVESGLHLQLNGSLAAEEQWATVNTCAGGLGSAPTVGGLDPDSDHHFVLTARNGDGVVSASAPPSATVVTWAFRPDAPAVTADALGNLRVLFDAGGNPTRTQFALAVNSRFANLAGGLVDGAVFATRAQWGADAGVLLQNLAPDTAHEVRLLARNAAGVETAASPPGFARTAPAAPEALSVVATGATSLRIQIQRGQNPATTEYEVEQVLPSVEALGTSTQTTLDRSGLTPATRYSYRARARGGDGALSVWVGPVEVVLAPAAPALPRVTARSTASLTLEHDVASDPNPSAAQYAFTVDGRYVHAGTGALLGTSPDDLAFVARGALAPVTVGGLASATRFELRSVVRGGDGTLAPSAAVSEATLPQAPASLAVTAGGDPARQLALTWQAAGNPAGTAYLIERHDGSGSFGRVGEVSTTSFVDGQVSALRPGATYTYRVQAQVHGQVSAFSGEASDTTWAVAPTTPVVQVPADGSPSVLEVTIPADANDASVRYAIQVVQGAITSWVRQAGSVEQLGASAEYRTRLEWGAIAVTGLLPNQPHQVLLRARNTALDPDQSSPQATRHTAATAPASLDASATQVQVALTWPASEAASYRLLREAVACNAPTQLHEGASLGYTDTAVNPGTTYCYRVHGVNGDSPPHLSAAYATRSITTVGAQPLAPNDLVVTNAAGAQTASQSDSPIRSLTPRFSARHQDQGGALVATRVRLQVRSDGGATTVYDAWHDLAPALAVGQKCPDLTLPYLVQPLPFTAATGFAVASAPTTGFIYLLEGGSGAVHRLQLATNQWDPGTALPALPVAAGDGAAMVYLASNNTLYAMPGGDDDGIFLLIVGGGAWSELPTPCGTIKGATALAVADVASAVHLFVYPGSGTYVWVYNVTSGARDCDHLTLPWTPNNGVAMAVTSDTLFITRGGGQQAFAATSLAGISATSHTYNPVLQHPTGVPDDMRMGGSLIAVDTLRLAVASGNSGPTRLYRYDFTAALPASGTFVHLADQPANSQDFNGNRLAYDATRALLYVLRGNGREIWTSPLTSAPLAGYPGAGLSAMVLDTRAHDFSLAFEDSDGPGALATPQSFVTAAP